MPRLPKSPPHRDERGQSSIEYVGAILFVCTVLAVLIGFAPDVAGAVGRGIKHAIDQVLGG